MLISRKYSDLRDHKCWTGTFYWCILSKLIQLCCCVLFTCHECRSLAQTLYICHWRTICFFCEQQTLKFVLSKNSVYLALKYLLLQGVCKRLPELKDIESVDYRRMGPRKKTKKKITNKKGKSKMKTVIKKKMTTRKKNINLSAEFV